MVKFVMSVLLHNNEEAIFQEVPLKLLALIFSFKSLQALIRELSQTF